MFVRFFCTIALALAMPAAGADDVLGTAPGAAAAADPAAQCPQPGAEHPIATEYGSAGFMKNLAESPDSIRAIAARLLEAALADRGNLQAAGCSGACEGPESTEIVYRVAPIAFLAREQQNDVCLDFEQRTRETPMRFGPRAFESVADLNEWIMAFSQGRGDDGKALYEQCSSNCSPRYTFHIAENGNGYRVRSEVQCGLARDKSNDQYLVSTALRYTCAVN